MRRIASVSLLALVSLGVALVAVEVASRAFFTRYREAADATFEPDALRILRHRPHARSSFVHPDTGRRHALLYNNLGMRQHRDFTESDLEGAVNVAFFGDSFLENKRVIAPHSFPEVLDYLLGSRGVRVNVLDFGTSGYGTDQSYIAYTHFERVDRLDHVFYVLCANDLRNIHQNALFSLGEGGELVRAAPPQLSRWVAGASRLHVTYFLLDLRERILGGVDAPGAAPTRRDLYEKLQLRERAPAFHTPRADAIDDDWRTGERNPDLDRSLAIFQALLRAWRREAVSRGASFHVVLLPREQEDRFADLLEAEYDVINLFRAFQREGYTYADLRFEREGHWNEHGNLLAARHLHRILEPALGLPALSESQVEARLRTWYAAFPGAWTPPRGPGAPPEADPDEARRIRRKYLALEAP